MARRTPQIPGGRKPGYDAIFDSSCIDDIAAELRRWGSCRAVLVYSKSLAAQTSVVRNLKQQLGSLLVAEKAGVGAHSPYADVIDIAHMLHESDADVLISIGSGSYSDACKTARLLHATLPPRFTADDMEDLIDQENGLAPQSAVQTPAVKLICVPTSLSAGEWNCAASCTNASGKKQHFALEDGIVPNLILLDPKVASTAPERLWLASGFRAIDHCVECLCNPSINPHTEAIDWAQTALKLLLQGLTEYRDGKAQGKTHELLSGISLCQEGSRDSLLPLIIYRIPLGPSHALGHQLGSVGGVMHGVTSAILLANVLRYTRDRNPTAQAAVLRIFNDTMDWEEEHAADAIERFAKLLELPTRLREIGVTTDEQVEQITEHSLTDAWGGSRRQLERRDISDILLAAR